MKVKLDKNESRMIPYYLLDAAKQLREHLIEDCKDDGSKCEDYARQAAACLMEENPAEIIKADAFIAVNDSTPFDRFFEGSEHLEVFVRFTARFGSENYTSKFLEAYCPLSAIWEIIGMESCNYLRLMSWFEIFECKR